ncbi:MAG: hypothetical protein NTW82_13390 [Bacteroidia bacterium]|nr:hypothetical protein [Bacteroidia bacterium]
MKTINYFLIPVILIALLASSFIKSSATEHTILIQASDKNTSSVSLSQSAEIISNRLKDFSTGKFDITVIDNKKQIKVVLTDDWDLPIAEDLIVHKGDISFYETYNHSSLVEMLNGDNHLFELLTKGETDGPDEKIGCASGSQAEKVNEYLKTMGSEQKFKFAWTQNFDKTKLCLFALKINNGKSPVLTGNDIESAAYDQDKIQIKIKDSAVGSWSEATKRNLGNVIAILLDDYVISYPKVMSSIDSGEIEITGKFTKTEAGYVASIISNGVLPASFTVVK